MGFVLKCSAARCGLAEARGTKGAWHGVSHPLIAPLELLGGGVNRCTKHVPAWRQPGQAEGHCCQQITCTMAFFFLFYFLFGLKLYKEAWRSWHLSPTETGLVFKALFFFSFKELKIPLKCLAAIFLNTDFPAYSVLEKEPPLKLQESHVLASPLCQIHLVPDPHFSAKDQPGKHSA